MMPEFSTVTVPKSTVEWRAANELFDLSSMTGNEGQKKQASMQLRDLGFHPELFLKEKGKRSKGVDLTLAKDLLSHAFFGNYDVAVLLAGDGDYVPLVKEVKRMGKVVYSIFFQKPSMSSDLRLVSDHTLYLDDMFLKSWTASPAASVSEAPK